MSGGFVKKTIDLEALQRQAEQAALEEEAKKNANTKKPKEKKVREKKVKEKKVREEKKGKEKKGKEEKEKKAKKSSSSSSLNSGKSSSKSKKSKVKLGPRLFGLPLTTSEDGEPPEFFTDIITYLEGHGISSIIRFICLYFLIFESLIMIDNNKNKKQRRWRVFSVKQLQQRL